MLISISGFVACFDPDLIIISLVLLFQECDAIEKSLERELKQARIQKQIESTQMILEKSRRGVARAISPTALSATMGLQDRLTKGSAGLAYTHFSAACHSQAYSKHHYPWFLISSAAFEGAFPGARMFGNAAEYNAPSADGPMRYSDEAEFSMYVQSVHSKQ